MFETDTTKAQQIQSDVLLEDTKNNPYFTAHTVPAKNKALDTTSKKVVGAINEILKKQNSLQTAVQTSINQSFEATGDFIADPELLTKLREVSPNIIEAVCDHDEKINTINNNISNIQLLINELKKKNNSGGNSNFSFGEDDMSNLQQLLRSQSKDIKDGKLMVQSYMGQDYGTQREIELPIRGGELTVLKDTDVSYMKAARILDVKYYNYADELSIISYTNQNDDVLDTSEVGQKTIECVPPIGYFSSQGSPYFSINIVDQPQQIFGVVYGEDGYTHNVKSGDNQYTVMTEFPTFIRFDENFNEINLIGEGMKYIQDIRNFRDDKIGFVTEFPTAWVKTEVLQSGPYAGKLCWWIANYPADGFHVHPAFIKPDGTYGKLQISSYVMQHHKDTTNVPYSIRGSNTYDKLYSAFSGDESGNYYKECNTISEIKSRVGLLDPEEGWNLYSIYDHHFITRLMLTEFGRTPFGGNAYYCNYTPYVIFSFGLTQLSTRKTYRSCYHGLYDIGGSWYGDCNTYSLYINGIDTSGGTLRIMAPDGSRQMIDTGITYDSSNGNNVGNIITGTINGIDFGDLFIRTDEKFGSDRKKFFQGSQQYFVTANREFTNKEELVSLNSCDPNGTTKCCWRVSRVV